MLTTSHRSHSPRSTVAALVGLWLCWGSSFPAIRVMVASLPPLLSCATIFLVAGTVLALARPRALFGSTRRAVATAAGTGICLLAAQGAVAVAERHVFASVAALVVAAVPLWVVVLRAIVGDRPAPGGVLRLLIGFAGVATLLLSTSHGEAGWSGWTLVVVGAAILWAAGTVWASRATSLPDPRTTTAIQLLTGGVVLLIVGVAAGEPLEVNLDTVRPASWAALAYLVAIDSLTGFALYNRLLRSAPLTLVSTYAYAVPVVAYLIGVILLGEPFHLLTLIAAAAIVAAVAAEVRA